MFKKILRVIGIVIALLIVVCGVRAYFMNDQVAIIKAVKNEDRETLSYYINKKGIDVNNLYQGFDLYNIYADQKKKNMDAKFINYMLQLKISPNPSRKNESMPILTSAVIFDRKDIVDILIKNGADVNYVDWKNYSAMAIALKLSNCEIAKTLIDHGAEINSAQMDNMALSNLNLCQRNNWVSIRKTVLE